MDENGGFVHRKCNAYNGGKVSEIDQIERIELFEVIEFDGTFQLAAPSQDVFFVFFRLASMGFVFATCRRDYGI